MTGKIVLVTGGARSGKSSFAETYVANLGVKTAYIATAQALDDEMALRIDLHRARRPADWLTYEAPLDADKVLTEAIIQAEAVLFDCLTMYVSNMLLFAGAPPKSEERLSQIQAEITKLLDSAKAGGATVVFVTSEVGLGIVPENALAREYRDLVGLANQQLAVAADEVYLVVSGLALEVKKNAVNLTAEK